MDPSAIPVADYDEDPEEAFIGPDGVASFFEEDGTYLDEGEEDFYDGDGSQELEPLELSAAQRGDPSEVPHAGIVSDHTHQLDTGG